jgi:hypothetical protein
VTASMGSPASLTNFESVDVFYEARGGRLSGELDFGVWWRKVRGNAPFRISFIEDTGDIYAVNLWSHEVTLLAAGRSRAKLEKSLDEWAEHCGRPGSYEWAVRRLGGDPER